MDHRPKRRVLGRVLIGVAVMAIAGCGTATPSVGPCEMLHVDDVGTRVLAVCWSDQETVLRSTNRAELLGPGPRGLLELFEQFAEARDDLQLRGVTAPRVESGFRYQLSYPQIVQGRAQYDLEVALAEALPASSIGGPAKEVVEFVRRKHPNAPAVSLDLIPKGSETIGSVTLHFDRWTLRRLILSQYRAKS